MRFVMTKRTESRQMFIDALNALGKDTVSRQEIRGICRELGVSAQWYTKEDGNRIGRGLYKVPSATTINMQAQVIQMPKETKK